MTPKQHKYHRGVLLYGICRYLEIPEEYHEKASRKIHNAIKDTFDVSSFDSLGVSEYEKIAATIRMIFCREFGYMIPEADEEDFDADKATLHELLKFKKIIK